jgi:hypothetical protein
MGKGGLRTELGDNRFLLRQPAGKQTVIDLSFTERIILGPFVFGFDAADFLGMANPLLQKLKELVVDGIYFFAYLFKLCFVYVFHGNRFQSSLPVNIFQFKEKELKASLYRRKEKRHLLSKKVALSHLILLQLSAL